VKQADDAVAGFFARTRRRPNPDAPHVHADRPGDDIMNDRPGNDHAGIGTRLAGRVLNMLPDQRRRSGVGLDVQEKNFLRRLNGQFFQMRIDPVVSDVIHPDKPGLLSISDDQLPVFL
jgi:hypothetical protein